MADPKTGLIRPRENIRNVYNLAAEKSVDATDTPNSFVLSYVYELPVGKGKKFGSGMNGVANQILGGWQTSGIFTFKQGFPLSITQPDSNHYFGVGQHVNVVGDYHVANPNRMEWFNTSAFAAAPHWTLGDAPRYFSDLRAPHYNNWDIGIQKNFPIQERTRLQFRLDMFNAFNHTNFYSAEYLPRGREFRNHYSNMDAKAHAGSLEIVLVICAKNRAAIVALLFDVLCFAGSGIFARTYRDLNLSWPRRNKPRPGEISNLPPNSTGRRSPSILKSPNSRRISG